MPIYREASSVEKILIVIFESQSKKKVVEVRVDIGSLKRNQQDPPQSKTGVAAVTAAGGDSAKVRRAAAGKSD